MWAKKAADIWTKTPPRQFSILNNDLAETFKSSVLTEQMLVVLGTLCLQILIKHSRNKLLKQ